jgi:transmembrane sensor
VNAHDRNSAELARIEATAAAWLAQRDGGLSADERVTFQNWCDADPRHAAAVARLERTWRAFERLRGCLPDGSVRRDGSSRARPRFSRRWWPAIVGAAVSAMLMIAVVRWNADRDRGADPTALAELTNGPRELSLPDGSVVELNGDSEVRVEFSAGARRVQLLRGEAHFLIAKDPGRPFHVKAGERIAVLVTEGVVEVSDARTMSSMPPVTSEPAPALAVTLGAGQRMTVRFDPEPVAPVIEQLAPAVIREALSWQEPRLVFASTPLAEVIAQFNRHNRVQLVLGDADLGALPIGGSFRAKNLEAFVRLLAGGNDVVVERPDADHIVLRYRR